MSVGQRHCDNARWANICCREYLSSWFKNSVFSLFFMILESFRLARKRVQYLETTNDSLSHRSSHCRFLLLPDMIKNAPFFKNVGKNKSPGAGLGVGRGRGGGGIGGGGPGPMRMHPYLYDAYCRMLPYLFSGCLFFQVDGVAPAVQVAHVLAQAGLAVVALLASEHHTRFVITICPLSICIPFSPSRLDLNVHPSQFITVLKYRSDNSIINTSTVCKIAYTFSTSCPSLTSCGIYRS